MCKGMFLPTCRPCVPAPTEDRRGRQSPGTGDTGGCELPNMGVGEEIGSLERVASTSNH